MILRPRLAPDVAENAFVAPRHMALARGRVVVHGTLPGRAVDADLVAIECLAPDVAELALLLSEGALLRLREKWLGCRDQRKAKKKMARSNRGACDHGITVSTTGRHHD